MSINRDRSDKKKQLSDESKLSGQSHVHGVICGNYGENCADSV